MSLLSRCAKSRGILAGANIACQPTDSKAIPDCASVGTSGKATNRLSPLTASMRNLPPRTLGIKPVVEAICMSIVLESTACVASAAPLKGTCMRLAPAASPKASLAKCGVVPAPPEP